MPARCHYALAHHDAFFTGCRRSDITCMLLMLVVPLKALPSKWIACATTRPDPLGFNSSSHRIPNTAGNRKRSDRVFRIVVSPRRAGLSLYPQPNDSVFDGIVTHAVVTRIHAHICMFTCPRLLTCVVICSQITALGRDGRRKGCGQPALLGPGLRRAEQNSNCGCPQHVVHHLERMLPHLHVDVGITVFALVRGGARRRETTNAEDLPEAGRARHLGGRNAHKRERTADRGPGVCKIPSRHDVTYRTAVSRRVTAAAAMAAADISGVL